MADQIDREYDFERRYYIGKYHPYWLDKQNRIKNPQFDNYCAKILDLKRGEEHAINFFYDKLKVLLKGVFCICVVPSHDPEKTISGIRLLAQKLADSSNDITDCTGCVIRKFKIPKLSAGGNRNSLLQYMSIEIRDVDEIHGKTVVLLDDVMTTGNSMKAGMDRILEAGAVKVLCFALAQTFSDADGK